MYLGRKGHVPKYILYIALHNPQFKLYTTIVWLALVEDNAVSLKNSDSCPCE